MEAAQSDVVAIIDKFLEAKDFANVFKFANVLLDKGQKQRKLESLLEVADTTPLIKAKAQAELAELLGEHNDRQRRDYLRASAHPVLQREHFHTALDIDINLAIERLQESKEGPNETDVDNLLQAYRALDYPNGLKKWLHTFVDIATKSYDLEAQHALEEELKALSIKTGTLSFLLVLRVNNMARFHQNTGYNDLVKMTLLDTYDDLLAFELPFTLGQVGFILVDIFANLRDVDQTVEWANRCVSHWSECPPATQSTGNLQLLRAEILRFQESGSTDYKAVQSLCEEVVASDLAGSLQQEAIMKLDLMSGLFYSCTEVPLNERFSQIHRYLARSESILDSITHSDIRLQKAALLQRQATCRIFYGSHRTDIEMEEGAIELLKQSLDLTYAASNHTLSFQLITIREQMGLTHHACFTKLASSDCESSRGHLEAAEECFSLCVAGRQAMGTTAQVAECKYWIALLRYERRIQGWATSNEVLHHLLDAEAAFDALRIEISVSSGLSAVKDKQALSKQKHVRDIYRFAFQVCILDQDAAGAWQWVQKSKARSLSDTLGLGCLIPDSLLSRIKSEDRTKELHEQEQELSQRLKSLAPAETFSIAIELRRLQEQMSAIPVLREVRDLRQGKAVTGDELLVRWQRLPVGRYVTDVAFVDWYLKGDDEIYVLILQPAANPVLHRVNATAQDVRSWIKQYFRSEDGQNQSIGRRDDHPSQALRALDSLVEFIGDYVREDTLLVLSPAAPLDVLPLHALHLRIGNRQQPWKPLSLIERHPIVYCSNMTVFIQCCELAASKSPTSGLKASFMAVYEEMPDEPLDLLEQRAVYDSIHDLASDHGASVAVGRTVSRNTIFTEWPSADYILFHGHCDLSSMDITEQSLILAGPTASADEPPVQHLTVKEAFGLKLNGPLVALMACSSSAQQLSAGDEPLGLVTALLCAGAASVVGTLWPVASGTARRFAAIFGQQLKALQAEGLLLTDPEQKAEPPAVHGAIDLAVALQRTVRQLKHTGPQPTRTPEHWATFAVHGSAFSGRVSRCSDAAGSFCGSSALTEGF